MYDTVHFYGIAFAGEVTGALHAVDNKQLLKIFDPVENAMFVTTSRGEIVDASKVACALLGYTKKELLMKGRGDIFPPAVAAHLIEIA